MPPEGPSEGGGSQGPQLGKKNPLALCTEVKVRFLWGFLADSVSKKNAKKLPKIYKRFVLVTGKRKIPQSPATRHPREGPLGFPQAKIGRGILQTIKQTPETNQ